MTAPSATPRTDAVVLSDKGDSGFIKDLVSIARTLERELAAANEHINLLEDAGDAMASLLDGIGEADTWREAKQARQ